MQYTPTQVILDNMQRGIALKSKYSTRTSTASVVSQEKIQKAKQIVNSDFDLDSVKTMYYELVKLEKNLDFNKRLHDNGPTEEVIKFYAFGGSAGLAWSRMILKQNGILKSYTEDIKPEDTTKQEDSVLSKSTVIKALNEEKRQATFLVLEPQYPDGMTTDLHGDWYDEETVAKSCHNFNMHCQKANLFHMVNTEAFSFIESYVLPVDGVIGEKMIRKGSWLATIQVSESPEGDFVWNGIKDGTFNGLSVQCLARVEDM